MANIINSLFGIDPAAMQQQQANTDFNQAYRFAQLTPMQRANLSLYQGGAGLTRGVAQLLGGDEQLNRATQIRQLASQYDLTTPEGLQQYAQAAAQIDPAVAQAAIERANQLTTAGLTQGKITAETIAKVREKDPEIIRLQNTRDALEKEFGPNDRRVVELNNIIAGRAKAGQTILQFPDTTGKAFEAADPEALKEYRKESRAAGGQLVLINQARENLPRAVVGQGLPALIRGLNTQLAPLGINTDQVAASRNLEQALKSIIAQGIKQYGANPSTVDLQFAQQAATNIQDPIEAIRATLDYLENRAKSSVEKANAAESYLLQNRNLAGFEKQWTQQVTGPKPGKKQRTLPSGIVVTEE